MNASKLPFRGRLVSADQPPPESGADDDEQRYQQSLFGQQWKDLPRLDLPWFLRDLPEAQRIETPSCVQWLLPMLTPLMAEALLKLRHPGQRNLRTEHVRSLRQCMEAGRWKNTGAPLALLNELNYMVDGQNRLTGLSQAQIQGLPDVTIVQLLDEGALSYVDAGGKSRTAIDVMTLMGHPRTHGSVVAAISLEHSDFNRHSVHSAPERAQRAMQCEYLSDLTALYTLGRNLKVGAGPLAAALRCMRRNRPLARAFFGAAFSNSHVVNEEPSSQAKALADYLTLVISRSRNGVRSNPTMQAAATIKAWNAWRERREIKIVRGLAPAESFPIAV